MCIKQNDNLDVYNFTDYLENDSPSAIFTKTGENMPDFEIMTDKILWATDYYGNYQYCDLNGNNTSSGNAAFYIYTFHFTGDKLYFVGPSRLNIYDNDLTELLDFGKFCI